MIDIHSHILAGIDDGAKSLDESIEMAKIAVQEGITTLFATPHHIYGKYETSKNDIIQKVDELNKALEKENIPLQVLPGQEVRIHNNLLEDYRLKKIATFNDHQRYILIEFPYDHVPLYTEQLLYDIQFEGLIPIIVHPEKQLEFMENPFLLYNFVKKGALTQITAASVVGSNNRKVKRFTNQIIEANLTHFIASDAHNKSNRNFRMKEAYSVIRSKYGEEMVELFQSNAELLLQDQFVHKEMPDRVKKKKLLGIL